MKLTHIAIVLTLGLVGVMAWLLMDARSDARAAHNKLGLYEHRGEAPQDPVMQSKEDALLLAQMQKQNDRTAVTLTPPPPLPPAPAPAPISIPAPGSAPTQPHTTVAPNLAASPHIGSEALSSTASLVTPQQRVVMNAPALAQVKEVHNELGFVIITAGSGKKVEKDMMFALRRVDSVVGRIKVTEIENGEAVGALEAHSVPNGVAVQIGDDVIQDIPQE